MELPVASEIIEIRYIRNDGRRLCWPATAKDIRLSHVVHSILASASILFVIGHGYPAERCNVEFLDRGRMCIAPSSENEHPEDMSWRFQSQVSSDGDEDVQYNESNRVRNRTTASTRTGMNLRSVRACIVDGGTLLRL